MAMPLNVLEVPEEVAKAKLAAYREAWRVERRAEDGRIRRGFEEIAKGRLVISLARTIEAGWFDETTGLPKLAIARADAQVCRVARYREELTYWWTDRDWLPTMRNHVSEHGLRVEVPNPGGQTVSSGGRHVAIVPVVPPEHRPRRGRGYANLHAFHVLWEANWRRLPMKDPALVRHLGGDLWVVHATWDLTALEAAVLTDRANGR